MTEHQREPEHAVAAAREAFSVRRVFGEAYEAQGATVIPVAAILGSAGQGSGGGSLTGPRSRRARAGGAAPESTIAGATDTAGTAGSGSGGGFWMRARPVGAYVISDGTVTWRPAVDLVRIIRGGQVVLALAVVATACTLRARRARR